MIFGKEYDLSLWYMLKVKNKYRKKTIDFIKELPEEFLENIRAAYCKGTEKNAGLDDEQDPFYNIQSSVDPNIYYKFYIMCRDLHIYKMKTVDGVKREFFSLVLNQNDAKSIVDMPKNHKKPLGIISVGQYSELSYKEVDYDLKKTRFGNMISYTYVLLDNLIEIKLSRPTSIKNMPDEMYRNNSHQKKLIKFPKVSERKNNHN